MRCIDSGKVSFAFLLWSKDKSLLYKQPYIACNFVYIFTMPVTILCNMIFKKQQQIAVLTGLLLYCGDKVPQEQPLHTK